MIEKESFNNAKDKKLEPFSIKQYLQIAPLPRPKHYYVNNVDDISALEKKLNIFYQPGDLYEKSVAIAPVAALDNQYGVYAVQNMSPNSNGKPTSIGTYVGVRKSISEKEESFYAFEIAEDEHFIDVYDATKFRNWTAFVNHSPHPNCRFKIRKEKDGPKVYLEAITFIAAGQQILIDYGKNYFQHLKNPVKPLYLHCTDDWRSPGNRYNDAKNLYCQNSIILNNELARNLGITHTQVVLATQLFGAVLQQDVKKVAELLRQKHDVEQPTYAIEPVLNHPFFFRISHISVQENLTPLMLACCLGNASLIEMLIADGADTSRCTLHSGKNAWHFLMNSNISEKSRHNLSKLFPQKHRFKDNDRNCDDKILTTKIFEVDTTFTNINKGISMVFDQVTLDEQIWLACQDYKNKFVKSKKTIFETTPDNSKLKFVIIIRVPQKEMSAQFRDDFRKNILERLQSCDYNLTLNANTFGIDSEGKWQNKNELYNKVKKINVMTVDEAEVEVGDVVVRCEAAKQLCDLAEKVQKNLYDGKKFPSVPTTSISKPTSSVSETTITSTQSFSTPNPPSFFFKSTTEVPDDSDTDDELDDPEIVNLKKDKVEKIAERKRLSDEISRSKQNNKNLAQQYDQKRLQYKKQKYITEIFKEGETIKALLNEKEQIKKEEENLQAKLEKLEEKSKSFIN